MHVECLYNALYSRNVFYFERTLWILRNCTSSYYYFCNFYWSLPIPNLNRNTHAVQCVCVLVSCCSYSINTHNTNLCSLISAGHKHPTHFTGLNKGVSSGSSRDWVCLPAFHLLLSESDFIPWCIALVESFKSATKHLISFLTLQLLFLTLTLLSSSADSDY